MNNNKGLTMVELLVTVIILGIIMTAAIALHLYNQRLYSRETSMVDLRSNVNGAMDIIMEDLRIAGFNPKETPGAEFMPGITTAEEHLVQMRADTDTNGVCGPGEEITYEAYNNNLYKYIILGSGATDTQMVAKDIDYLEFVYLDREAVEFTRPVTGSSLDSIIAVKVIIVGATSKEFLNNTSTGTYRDGTSYNDRKHRYWDSTYVRLRNM